MKRVFWAEPSAPDHMHQTSLAYTLHMSLASNRKNCDQELSQPSMLQPCNTHQQTPGLGVQCPLHVPARTHSPRSSHTAGFVIMQKELFQNTQFTSHFDEALHSMINILWAVNCTHLYPHASLVLRNNRVAKTNDVYAFVQQLRCHVRSQASVPKHHRLQTNDCVFRLLCPGANTPICFLWGLATS